jgi:hypothetical protein
MIDRARRLLGHAAFTGGLLIAGVPCTEAVDRSGGWRFQFSPADDLYPVYVADPRRPTNSFDWMIADREIPDTGDTRFGLRAGGRFAVGRFHREATPDRGFDIAIEAGFRGLFDFDNSWDLIGWDGVYGLHLGWAPARGRVVYRFALAHDSSHVGDEYAERTGRRRIDYTREEWLAGASAPLGRDFRIYGEAGVALGGEDFQEAGRAQVGFEWHPPRRMWGGRMGWFGAIDLDAFEESDWDVGTTLQGGIEIPVEEAARTWRVAVTVYDGRSLIGEFFEAEEPAVSIGLGIDF